MTVPRRPRADALRNRAALVAAATDVFAEHGTDAPLDDIARRAGVGNATLYRHFPTRRDLVVAVYADEVTALCAYGELLLEQECPGDALFGWLRAFVDHVGTRRDLAPAITDDEQGSHSSPFSQWHEAMRSTASMLVNAAISAGDIYPGADVTDLLSIASGIAQSGSDNYRTSRLLAIVSRGMRVDDRTNREAPGSSGKPQNRVPTRAADEQSQPRRPAAWRPA